MWGIKMKQTVEAMKTILGDLRSNDQFSILDFNHNVRCWRDSLVQASKLQTEAAKKYVEGIHPNGGTNINDALLRAMFILNEANALGMLDPNSVSMIILVSDGDPTKFYNQVSTPLLKKLDFNYPEGLVSDVTQNTFQHYFGGSEIVVSGKVDTENVQHLQSVVTATASNAQLILETLADVEGLDEFLYQDKHADPKFTEKLNVAPSAAVKRNITKAILQMSLDHHIVTPYTAMLIENPDGDELMLADSPQDRKRACCPVDNDPHFIITLPRQQKNICFNIDSQPGATLNLISDPESRITINGKLIGAKRFLHNKLNTYFGKIGFNFEAKGLKVEVSPEAITLKDGSSTTSLSWSETGSLIRRRLMVSVKKESNVTLTLDGDLTFMVLLHRVWKKHPVNVDFLGIYIPPANNFSSSQFMQEPDVVIYNERPGQDPGKSDATMEVKGHKLTVTR
ncbi:hypothetical protein E2320_004358 [Naja naja]|nr:hypothetical protein E2320_004358 [Naja naja]